MKADAVLAVDDEKNIRFMLSHALKSLDLKVDGAVNGEEALAMLKEGDYSLLLLDLKMPGMDGLEVLRRVREMRPEMRVMILTAHGTVASAVEAMKLGAVDFVQKPFSPREIRALVAGLLRRETLDEGEAGDYATHIELAKRCAGDRRLDAAIEQARQAIGLDASRPEAFNLLGAFLEIQGHSAEAQKNYRAALSLDPTYKPARENLDRTTGAGAMTAYGYGLAESLFESASALGTVGLSVGVTSAQSPPPVLWVATLEMFLGRLEFFVVFSGLAKMLRGACVMSARC